MIPWSMVAMALVKHQSDEGVQFKEDGIYRAGQNQYLSNDKPRLGPVSVYRKYPEPTDY